MAGWTEIGRYAHPASAINAVVQWKLTSAASWIGKTEEVASRSRPGETSWAAFVREAPGEKQPLDVVEDWYVRPASVRSNPVRRNSRARRRTSRRR